MLKGRGMVKEEDLAARAEDALKGCLKEVPFLYVTGLESGVAPEAPDLLVRLTLPNGEQTLAVEIRSNGQPRQVREAATRLHRLRESVPDAYGVVAAPYVSPRAAEVCAEEGIGFVDLAGNCRLVFGQVYIERQGNPNQAARRRALRSLYSPKAERVLRVLVANPSRPWKMQPLATEARVSLGQAANVKKLLADREWIRRGANGFWLAEPEALLAEWAAAHARRRSRVDALYSIKDVEETERELANACRDEGLMCAFTAFSAAARLAPAVRYERASAYVERDSDALIRRLGLRRVTSGANIHLLTPYDEGVFYGASQWGEVSLVLPVQAYLDLQGPAGRAAEAAVALLEEVIRPQWRRSAQATGLR